MFSGSMFDRRKPGKNAVPSGGPITSLNLSMFEKLGELCCMFRSDCTSPISCSTLANPLYLEGVLSLMLVLVGALCCLLAISSIIGVAERVLKMIRLFVFDFCKDGKTFVVFEAAVAVKEND